MPPNFWDDVLTKSRGQVSEAKGLGAPAVGRILEQEEAPGTFEQFFRFLGRPGFMVRSAMTGDMEGAARNGLQFLNEMFFLGAGAVNANMTLTNALSMLPGVELPRDLTEQMHRPEFTDVMRRWGVADPRFMGGMEKFGYDLVGGILTDPLTLVGGPPKGVASATLKAAMVRSRVMAQRVAHSGIMQSGGKALVNDLLAHTDEILDGVRAGGPEERASYRQAAEWEEATRRGETAATGVAEQARSRGAPGEDVLVGEGSTGPNRYPEQVWHEDVSRMQQAQYDADRYAGEVVDRQIAMDQAGVEFVEAQAHNEAAIENLALAREAVAGARAALQRELDVVAREGFSRDRRLAEETRVRDRHAPRILQEENNLRNMQRTYRESAHEELHAGTAEVTANAQPYPDPAIPAVVRLRRDLTPEEFLSARQQAMAGTVPAGPAPVRSASAKRTGLQASLQGINSRNLETLIDKAAAQADAAGMTGAQKSAYIARHTNFVRGVQGRAVEKLFFQHAARSGLDLRRAARTFRPIPGDLANDVRAFLSPTTSRYLMSVTGDAWANAPELDAIRRGVQDGVLMRRTLPYDLQMATGAHLNTSQLIFSPRHQGHAAELVRISERLGAISSDRMATEAGRMEAATLHNAAGRLYGYSDAAITEFLTAKGLPNVVTGAETWDRFLAELPSEVTDAGLDAWKRAGMVPGEGIGYYSLWDNQWKSVNWSSVFNFTGPGMFSKAVGAMAGGLPPGPARELAMTMNKMNTHIGELTKAVQGWVINRLLDRTYPTLGVPKEAQGLGQQAVARVAAGKFRIGELTLQTWEKFSPQDQELLLRDQLQAGRTYHERLVAAGQAVQRTGLPPGRFTPTMTADGPDVNAQIEAFLSGEKPTIHLSAGDEADASPHMLNRLNASVFAEEAYTVGSPRDPHSAIYVRNGAEAHEQALVAALSRGGDTPEALAQYQVDMGRALGYTDESIRAFLQAEDPNLYPREVADRVLARAGLMPPDASVAEAIRRLAGEGFGPNGSMHLGPTGVPVHDRAVETARRFVRTAGQNVPTTGPETTLRPMDLRGRVLRLTDEDDDVWRLDEWFPGDPSNPNLSWRYERWHISNPLTGATYTIPADRVRRYYGAIEAGATPGTLHLGMFPEGGSAAASDGISEALAALRADPAQAQILDRLTRNVLAGQVMAETLAASRARFPGRELDVDNVFRVWQQGMEQVPPFMRFFAKDENQLRNFSPSARSAWETATGDPFYVPHQIGRRLQEMMDRGLDNPTAAGRINDLFTQAREYPTLDAFVQALEGMADDLGVGYDEGEDLMNLNMSEVFYKRMVSHEITKARQEFYQGMTRLRMAKEAQGAKEVMPGDYRFYINRVLHPLARLSESGEIINGSVGRENFAHRILAGGMFQYGGGFLGSGGGFTSRAEALRFAESQPEFAQAQVVQQQGKFFVRMRYGGLNALWKPFLTSVPHNIKFRTRNVLSNGIMLGFSDDVGWEGAKQIWRAGLNDPMVRILTKEKSLRGLIKGPQIPYGQADFEGDIVTAWVRGLTGTSISEREAARNYLRVKNARVGPYSADQVMDAVAMVAGQPVSPADLSRGADIIPELWHSATPLNATTRADVPAITRARNAWHNYVKWGEELSNEAEARFRIVGMLNLLQKGVDPVEAAARVTAAMVDYSKQSYIERALRDVFPFARFQIGSAAWAKKMLQNPSVSNGSAINLQTLGLAQRSMLGQIEGGKSYLPTEAQGSIALPLPWRDAEGNYQFLTSLGLPHEATIQILGVIPGLSPEAVRRNVLGGLNPPLRAVAEPTVGKSFYYGTDYGGYRKAPFGALNPLAEKIPGRNGGEARYEVNGMANEIWNALPFSGSSAVAERLVDSRRGWFNKLVVTTTGTKITSVDMEREIKRRVAKYLDDKIQSGQIGEVQAFFTRQSPENVPEDLKIMLKALAEDRAAKRKANKAGKKGQVGGV